MRKLLPGCLCIIMFVTNAYGQNTPVSSENMQRYVSVLSPNAGNINRYGNTEISLSTGIPKISLPLYEINVSGFKLPISLDYSGGGVKVDDVASWVGLGWNLNAGGAVIRNMRGVRDEKMVQFAPGMTSIYDYVENQSIPRPDREAQWMNAGLIYGSPDAPDALDPYDQEADIFYFNAGGAGGRFFLDLNGDAHTMPASKTKVRHEGTYTWLARSYYERWVVTTEDGVQYVFGKSLDNTRTVYERSAQMGACGAQEDNNAVNTWFLAEIVLVNGKKITFEYDTYTYCALNYQLSINNNIVTTTKYATALRLRQINFENGKIVFEVGGYRNDIVGERSLKFMKVYKTYQDEELVKVFEFKTNNPNTIPTAPVGQTDSKTARLYLEGLSELSPDNTQKKEYTFTYYQGPNVSGLPARASYAQDMWGYFNGQNQNSNPYPSWLPGTFSSGGQNRPQYRHYKFGSDRSIRAIFAQTGSLESITYPTGGTSTFEYESNTIGPCFGAVYPNLDICRTVDDLEKMATIPSRQENKTAHVRAESWPDYPNSSDAYSPEYTIQGNANAFLTPQLTIFGSGPCPANPNNTEYNCFSPYLQKKNPDGSWSTLGKLYNNIQFGQFAPGTIIRIRVVKNSWDLTKMYTVIVDVKWTEQIPDEVVKPAEGYYVGGLRVKSVTDIDPVTKQEIKREYRYTFNEMDNYPNYSSGSIMVHPMAHCTFFVSDNGESVFPYANADKGPPVNISSSSLNSYALDLRVNYGKVSVSQTSTTSGNLGRTDYYFTNDFDYPDEGIAGTYRYNYTPTNSYSWRRGLLKKAVQYKFESNTYVPVTEELNEYRFDASSDLNYFEQWNRKVKVGNCALWFFEYPCTVSRQLELIDLVYTMPFLRYKIHTESFNLSRNTKTQFDQLNGTKKVVVITDNVQDPSSLQMTETSMNNSDGTRLENHSKFPVNYTLQGTLNQSSLGIKQLKDLNITAPVETWQTVERNGQEYVVSGSLQVFRHDIPVALETYELSLSDPLPVASFTQSYIDGGGIFRFDSRYIRTSKVDLYNSKLNILQTTTKDGIVTSYVWGYNYEHPVAVVIGATFADVLVALGQTDQDLVSLQNLSTANLQTQLTNLRNNLAVNKPGATVTTYTYKPGVGILSEADARNRSSHYEYDGLNRLRIIRDKEGRILKHFDYQYQSSTF